MRVCVGLLFLSTFVLVSSLIPRGHRLAVEGLQRISSTSLYMAAKSSKKKKKDGNSPADSLPSPPASAMKPVRVTSNTNIPVRQQIAWAKAYKRLVSSNGFSKKDDTRKFRQQSRPKEAEEEYVEIDYKNVKPPALFVDGYNIIGYLNAVEGRSISFDEARDCLIADLSVLCGATGWFVEVIFDAYKVASPQSTQTIDSLLVTYTSMAETADNYIERRFTELSNSGYNNMVVATDDRVLRMAAGSLGYVPLLHSPPPLSHCSKHHLPFFIGLYINSSVSLLLLLQQCWLSYRRYAGRGVSDSLSWLGEHGRGHATCGATNATKSRR